MSSKVYEGHRSAQGWVEKITVDGIELHNYDSGGSDGFEWGYGGAGPYALALSILCDYFGVPFSADVDRETWRSKYLNDFKTEVVAKFSHEGGFRLTTEQLSEWIASKVRARSAQEERST